jgi:c-di-GMP-binding flagellar brake protein YcgR
MPPEIMERLRESIEEVSGASSEHRGDGRVAVGTTVVVTVTPADVYAVRSTMKMRVADFSGGGVGLLFGDTIPIGSDVTIHLPKKQTGVFNLRCVVCNCRAVADGVFRVGVRFENIEK